MPRRRDDLRPSQWGAVRCPNHGTVYLTKEQYKVQMYAADRRWICPHDGAEAEWIDAVYEAWMDRQISFG